MLNKSLLMLLALLMGAVWMSFSDELRQMIERPERFDAAKLELLIEKRTTREQVIALLGKPKQVLNKQHSVSYLYEYSDQLLALTFHEDVLLIRERAENDGRYDFQLVE
ncbi:hypothetical protein KI655_06440 [Vibrio sp. D404a]|uniref:hypothetical protein n=2 Tax=Vibrio TaxID=662 RepID=UPI002557A55D|nr:MULTISPECIES: hypothetical protein [unclassified Vibrio]MDK9736937.1 hypothetical protein [Vibrio sp. D404a]MDK9798084.1 hypothetical protein [Vibrio sp. D449a]